MPLSLSYAQPLFLEEQRGDIALGKFAPILKGFTFVYFIFSFVIVAKAFREMPLHLFVLITFAASIIGLSVVLSLYCTAVTVVESANVQIRITIAGRFSIFRRTIPVSQIVSVRMTEMCIGERKLLTFMPGGVYFMTRDHCVRLGLSDYREFVIGSQRPDELLQAVRQALSLAGDSKDMQKQG